MLKHFGDDFRTNRRAFLAGYAGALGPLALAHLLTGEGRAARGPGGEARPGHAATAKAVICLFQHGGPSQMDLFDPKPELTRWHGKPYPGSLEVHFNKQQGNLLASPYGFRPRGGAGIPTSDLLAHTATTPDDSPLVRSVTTESL